MNNQNTSEASGSSQYKDTLFQQTEASAAMHRDNQLLIAKHMSNRPINTVKAYSKRQQEWREWCKTHGDIVSGELVSDEKLAHFLTDYVSKKGKKGKPLGRESILQYVKAATDLHNQHCRVNSRTISKKTVRGPLVQAFLDTHARETVKQKRDAFEDRGDNTLNDGYNREEFKKIASYFLKDRNDVAGCRDRLCFLLGHAILGRSQTTLGIQFADLFHLELDTQGVTRCIALIITISFGKTNQHGKIEYGSVIRSRNVEECAVGALAFSLFSRFHYESEPFPDFTSRDRWYNTSLFPSKSSDKSQAIKYKTHSRSYAEAFEATHVYTSKVTHASRKSALNMMAQQNVSSDQQGIHGRWVQDRRTGCYNSSVPVQALKSLADFDPHSRYDYFLPRAEVIPPPELQSMIFPEVEYWLQKFDSRDENIQKDKAGPKFLKLLCELRVVFLQDSVVLKERYSNYYLWTSEIFKTDFYKDFERQLLEAIGACNGPFHVSQRTQMALPEMCAAVGSGLEKLSAQIKSISEKQSSEIRDVRQTLADFFALGNAHFNSQEPISFPPPGIISTSAPSTSSSTNATLSFPSSDPNTTTQWYTLNRDILTVTDVWREYTVGLSDCPAVKKLEEEHGTTWRKKEKESRYFNRRKELYVAIERKANEERVSCEEAVRRLEDTRQKLGYSLDKLRVEIKKRGTTNL